VLGLSCVTNLAAGILDQPISSEEVNVAAAAAGEQFGRLLKAIVGQI
jgi:purine-nucleoside phosphorylase